MTWILWIRIKINGFQVLFCTYGYLEKGLIDNVANNYGYCSCFPYEDQSFKVLHVQWFWNLTKGEFWPEIVVGQCQLF